MRREEPVWSEAFVGGGVEEREGKLVTSNYPYRFKCGGSLVRRARIWADCKGFGEVAQAAKGISVALGGHLRVWFVVRGGESEGRYRAVGRRFKHYI
jgi:hypothetical protein